MISPLMSCGRQPSDREALAVEHTRLVRTAVALAALAFTASIALASAPQSESGPPDLTKGATIPAGASHDWNLGATGARGWMFCEKLVTTDARQIAITKVESGSPADGVLEVGDVILGVGRRPFSGDPRRELGVALTAAETRAGGGRLKLIRWRGGKTARVVVKLPVLGAYGETAPYDCEKSRRILEQGCKALSKRMAAPSYRPNPIPRALNALALLASGDRTYLPLVKKEARWAAQFSAKSFQTWYYGYVIMLLAEYVQATSDDSVMPGLRRLAVEAAEGQSAVGSWGHRFAQPNGRLAGYGMMNAPGVPLTISLVLAREAGVKHRGVDRAIERSVRLLRFYVGKGAVPYGDHHPWIQTHEDNGKCGMAAVLFNLIGEAPAAEFFSRMSVASHGAERDTGHTGNFFNILWALPGLSLSGPAAAGVWMTEFGAWYFDLARTADGTFVHQGPPEKKKDKYGGWDATGAYLLAYALPRGKLMLTGARPHQVPQLDAAAAAALIADGRGWSNKDRSSFYDQLTEQELLGRLESWSPVVRERAAMALARAKLRPLPALLALLRSRRIESRYGACQALANLGAAAAPAVPALRKALGHDDLWLRVKAAEALAKVGRAATPALPDLLRRLAEPPPKEDPRGMEQRYLCFSLFNRRGGLLRHTLDDVDRQALYAAVRSALQNEDGRARSSVGSIFRTLSFEELEPLLPDIHRAIMESAPSGIMFADGIRMEGLKLLAKHRVQEGIKAAVHYLRFQKQHGSQRRVPEVLKILASYGGHAKALIPELQRIADYFENEETNFPKKLSRQKAKAVRDAARSIEDSKDYPDLIRIP